MDDDVDVPPSPAVIPPPPPPPPLPEPLPLDATAVSIEEPIISRSQPINGSDPLLEVPNDEEQIFKAVRYDHLEMIGRLIREGVDVNTLHLGLPCIVRCRVLMSHIRMTKYTPLHVAALQSPMETITYLVDNGADVNVCDENNRTPLHYVAAVGRADVIQYFIQKGADLNVQSASMKTPLMYSVVKQDPLSVNLLIKAGANLDILDEKGTSALHLACFTMPVNLFMVQLLLKAGANVNVANKKGATPLMMSVPTKEVALVNMLLDAGAKIEAKDNFRRTPVHSAVELSHNADVVKVLVQRGADINAADKFGSTPLSKSIKYGKMDTILLLLAMDCQRDMELLHSESLKDLRESYSRFNFLMEKELNIPRTLLRLCRYVIRNSVQKGQMAGLDDLLIPRTLKNYLQFK